MVHSDKIGNDIWFVKLTLSPCLLMHTSASKFVCGIFLLFKLTVNWNFQINNRSPEITIILMKTFRRWSMYHWNDIVYFLRNGNMKYMGLFTITFLQLYTDYCRTNPYNPNSDRYCTAARRCVRDKTIADTTAAHFTCECLEGRTGLFCNQDVPGRSKSLLQAWKLITLELEKTVSRSVNLIPASHGWTYFKVRN